MKMDEKQAVTFALFFYISESPKGHLNLQCNDISHKKKEIMQVNNFWKDGFLAGVPVLSEDDCDKLLEEVDAVSYNQNICK